MPEMFVFDANIFLSLAAIGPLGAQLGQGQLNTQQHEGISSMLACCLFFLLLLEIMDPVVSFTSSTFSDFSLIHLRLLRFLSVSQPNYIVAV